MLVPSYAGVGSAVGFLRAPIAYEIVRSSLQRLDEFDAAAANALFAAMRAEAEPIVRRGAGDPPLTETRSAFMRYRGQGHEIAVPLPTGSTATTTQRCSATRSRKRIAASTAALSPASRSKS